MKIIKKRFAKDISKHQISDLNRFLLLDNLNLMQRALYAKSTELLKLIEAYDGEENATVMGALEIAIGDIRPLVEPDTVHYKKLNDITLELTKNIVKKLGWHDKSSDDAQTLRLRGRVFGLAAGAKNQSIIDHALNIFGDANKPSDLQPSTRSTIYFCVARYGDDQLFAKLLKWHTSDISAEDKEEVASALCAAKDKDRINQLIGLLKTDKIRRQNLMSWYAGLLSNRWSRDFSLALDD
jgi:hypothetical protein